MEQLSSRREEWWNVVEEMAGYVACGVGYEELEEDFVRFSLLNRGFQSENIELALDWLEKASMSGNVADVFSMFMKPMSDSIRIINPLEKICLSDKAWKKFHQMRQHGIISEDLAERLIEGLRSVDTRDWEEDEVYTFLFEALSASLPNSSEGLLLKLLKQSKIVSEFYS